MKPAVTLVIRRRSSGYKVAALAVDSLEHAWTIANVVARSPEYSRCYVTANDWTGSEVFTVGLSPPSSEGAAATGRPPALPFPARDAYVHYAEVIDAPPTPSHVPQLSTRRS